jgi:hypothetical protein
MFSAKDRNPFLFFENCANLRSPVEYIPYILIKHNYLTKDAASLARRSASDARRIEKRIDRLQLKEPLPSEDMEAIAELQKELDSLLTLKKNEERTKYIFCGKPLKEDTESVIKTLKDISRTRKIPKNEHLEKNFGKNFKKYWGEIGEDYYSEIIFVFNYILPDSNVHYVQSLIEILLKVPIDYQYVWGQSDLLKAPDSLRFYFEDFYRFNYDSSEENVSKTNIQTFLTKLGLTREEISRSFDENEFLKLNSAFSIEDLMTEAPLSDIITAYFEYQSLNFQNIYQKKMKIGHFPDTNPFFAVVNDSTRMQYENLFTNERNRIQTANFYHKTLANFNLKNNEVHFVSFLDFSRFLKMDDGADLQPMVDSVFKRYFRSISDLTEYLEPNSEKRQSLDIVSADVVDSHDSVFHFMHTPIEIQKPNESSMSIINILESIFKVDYAFKNYFKMPLNLRDIVNQFRLNDRVPFVRLFDEQRNENIYRIFKDSFTMDNLDKINEDTFKSWLFMGNVTVELKQLTKIKEMKRCLTFKLRLCNQIKTFDDPLKIEEHNVIYEDHLEQSKFTVRYSKNGQIEGNIEEYLFTPDKTGIYQHQPVYMDVYIFADGTMRIKCVFDPNCIFNVNYLNAIQDAMNSFIQMIGEFPEVSNSFESIQLCDVLSRPNDNYLNSTLTNGCLLEYTYVDNFYVGYENLKHIVKMFTPYFVIIEADLDSDSTIVFYDRGSYRDAAIVKVLPNNRYNIRVRGEVSDIEDVPRYLLNLKGETKSIGFLNFRYKRVSNYKSEQEDDWHLDKDGIDIKFYFETQETSQRRYKIEIKNYKNVSDFNTVIELLGRILDLHYLYFVSKNLSVFEAFNLIQSDQIILAIAKNDVDVVPVQSDEVYSSLGLNPDNFQDFPDVSEFQSDEMMPSMEGFDFSPNAEPETPSAAAAAIVQESSTAGIETQQTTISSKNLLLSTLYESDLNQFKNYENEKWKYTTGCQPNNDRYPKPLKKTEFSKIVATVQVEPVADSVELPADELPYSAGLGLTYLGNKPGIASDPEEKYCVPGDAIDPKKKCVSIVYGSLEDQKNWQNVFMCPKIWCMRDRIPLHPRHLKDGECRSCGCKRFVSVADVSTKDYNADRKLSEQNDIDNWRTCKSCNHDILHHDIKCPVCKSGPLDAKNSNFRPTDVPFKTSMFISPLNGTYIYPGFLDSSNHPKNIHSMCCFKNPNFRLNQAYKMNVEVSEQSPKYIQSDGKSLDRGRCGQLPHNFKGFFDLPANYYNITSLADKTEKDNMLYRFGVNMGNNNVLDCMRAFLLKDEVFKRNPEILDDAFAKNVQLDILIQTPLMYNAMTDTTAANLSPVQIFIEYLYSDAYKYDMTFFQFLNRDWSWTGLQAATDIPEEISANGVNVFIFTINAEGKLVLELPLGYIQPYHRGENAYSILLFKKTELKKQMMECDPNEKSHVVYEPIFALKPQPETKKKSAPPLEEEPVKWDKFQKAFHWDHPIVKNIMAIIEEMGNQLVQAPKLIYADKDEFLKRTVEWLLREKERVQCLITDASNLVIGAVLKDKMYIPLFPTSYDGGTLPTMNQTSYWEDYDLLLNYEDCLDRLYAYQSRARFEWMRPVKIIRGKGGYIGFMTQDGPIVPFQEIKLVPNNMLPVMDYDYQEIENAINRFRQKMQVSKRMTFADLLDLKVSKEKMFILRDELANKLIKTILFPTGKDSTPLLKIPIEPETYNPDYHPNPYKKQSFKTYKYQEAIKMYHDLYYRMMGKIRCSPVGIRMNEDKKIQSIFLETGDEIVVSATVHVYDRDSKNTLLLHYFSNLEKSKSVSKLTGYDWNRYFMNVDEGDVRVHYIQTINYKIKSYIRFRFEIAQILSIYAIDKKKTIEKILQLPNSNQEKRKAIFEIIADIIVKFMSVEQMNPSVALVENSGDVLENCLSHNNNSTACSKDPFCSWHPMDESKKPDWIVSEKEKSSVDQEKMKEYIISNGYIIEDEPDESEVEALYWDLRFEQLGNCKLLLDSNVYTKFIHQIVEELVRNNLKRSEILGNTIKLVETNLSYNIYSGERFLTTSDVRQRLYEDIYCKLLRYRLKTLEYFTRNSSMYSKHLPELFITDLEESLKEFQLVHRQSLNIRFEMNGLHECVFPENNRQSLVRILDEVETQRALHRILVLNTPLDTYRVASTSTNVDFIIESIPNVDARTAARVPDAEENSKKCSVHKTMQECEKFDCLWGKTGKCSKKRATKIQEKPAPKAASPKQKPAPKAASPKRKPAPKAASPKQKPAPKAASPKRKPATSGFAEEVPLVENHHRFSLDDVVSVQGDGTCLFHSAAIGLRTVGAFEGTGHDLRKQTAQYLKDTLNNGRNLNVPFNRSTLNKLGALNTLTFRDYLSANDAIYQGPKPEEFMKQHIDGIAQHKWGTDIEVWAFRNMFPGVNIDVYSAPRGDDDLLIKSTVGQDDAALPTIRIYNAAGNNPKGMHYDALPASRPRGDHGDEGDVAAECPDFELGQAVRIKGQKEPRYFIDRLWSNERAGQCVAIRVVSRFINGDDINAAALRRISNEKLKGSFEFNNRDIVEYDGNMYEIFYTHTTKENDEDLTEIPTQHFIVFEVGGLEEVPLRQLELN